MQALVGPPNLVRWYILCSIGGQRAEIVICMEDPLESVVGQVC